jgi:hypothetical protein
MTAQVTASKPEARGFPGLRTFIGWADEAPRARLLLGRLGDLEGLFVFV